MRILIIGQSKSAKATAEYFLKDEENLVFTTFQPNEDDGAANFIDINAKDVCGLKEFAQANEINLTVLCDKSLFNIDYLTPFNEANLTILAPDIEAAGIATSKSRGKKCIYKNKIKTPKFAYFEKAIPAVDFARNSKFPIVIKPDCHSETEAPYIAETFVEAKRKIEKLFQTDNKKVLIEEYVWGKEFSIYVISDGFNAVLLDSVASFEDDVAFKGAPFIDRKTEEKIYSTMILPVISSLAREELEYIGVLGFDFIMTPEKEINLIEFNPYFKDLDAKIMFEGTEENSGKLFIGAITGTLTDEVTGPFEIKKSEDFWGAFYEGTEVSTACAKTKGMLKTKLLEEGMSKDLIDEAEKMWRL